jgi:uncharacterized membrane protein YcjF (UPF0283 family)
MDLDVVFAYVIAVLAGAAVIGALVVVLVAEWYALRRVIERHRRQAEQPETFWRNHSAVRIPERRP